MLGVGQEELAWPVGTQAAEVMQGTLSQAVTRARPSTTRAEASAIVARTLHQQRCRQVCDTGDALGGVREIVARSHARPSGAERTWKAQRNRAKRSRADQLPCYSVDFLDCS